MKVVGGAGTDSTSGSLDIGVATPGNVQELARTLDAACGESKVLLMWRGGGERWMGGMFGPFTVAGIVLMSSSAVNVVRARLSANTLLKVRPCWRALSDGLGVAAGTVAHWVLWFDWLGKRDKAIHGDGS